VRLEIKVICPWFTQNEQYIKDHRDPWLMLHDMRIKAKTHAIDDII